MMRAGPFRYHAASSAEDAAKVLAGEHEAMLMAGGTDVVPALKRQQQTPSCVVSLRRVDALRGIELNGELSIGAMTTLSDLVRDARLHSCHEALHRAAAQVATPLIRNTATIGGNVTLDTRCNYYNQNRDWREAIGFCKKAPAGGDAEAATCWVAPASKRCWAVSSGDTAPALIALGARAVLLSTAGERDIPLEALYQDDGIAPMTRRPDEVLTAIRVPYVPNRSTYWKLRRRGAFDFPVLGVAAAIRMDRSGVVEHARVVLGAVASRPLLVPETAMLTGRPLTDDLIREFARAAAVHAKPLDNTDFAMTWRKAVAESFLTGVLRELRGDDPGSFPLLMREASRPTGGIR